MQNTQQRYYFKGEIFNAISIQNIGSVDIMVADSNAIIIEAEENIFEFIEVTLNQQKASISIKKI